MVCHSSGISHTYFKKTGRFGCAHCYEVFSEGLENLLEAMHKNTKHHGKVPQHYEATKALHDQLVDLRNNLEASVAAENYEEAARLRDTISQLEAYSNQPENPEHN